MSLLASLLSLLLAPPSGAAAAGATASVRPVALPVASGEEAAPLQEALRRRRSVRHWSREPLTLSEVARVLWAAQGVTDPADGGRTAPSAGGLYPLEIHVVAGAVSGLPAGAWRYVPARHELVPSREGDARHALTHACLDQEWMQAAPAMIVIAGVTSRTARKYGSRAERYVHVEAGCAAQNVALHAATMGLGTVVVGAFDDDAVAKAVGLRDGEAPVLVMPLGRLP